MKLNWPSLIICFLLAIIVAFGVAFTSFKYQTTKLAAMIDGPEVSNYTQIPSWTFITPFVSLVPGTAVDFNTNVVSEGLDVLWGNFLLNILIDFIIIFGAYSLICYFTTKKKPEYKS